MKTTVFLAITFLAFSCKTNSDPQDQAVVSAFPEQVSLAGESIFSFEQGFQGMPSEGKFLRFSDNENFTIESSPLPSSAAIISSLSQYGRYYLLFEDGRLTSFTESGSLEHSIQLQRPDPRAIGPMGRDKILVGYSGTADIDLVSLSATSPIEAWSAPLTPSDLGMPAETVLSVGKLLVRDGVVFAVVTAKNSTTAGTFLLKFSSGQQRKIVPLKFGEAQDWFRPSIANLDLFQSTNEIVVSRRQEENVFPQQNSFLFVDQNNFSVKAVETGGRAGNVLAVNKQYKLFVITHTSTPVSSTHGGFFVSDGAGGVRGSGANLANLWADTDQASVNENETIVAIPIGQSFFMDSQNGIHFFNAETDEKLLSISHEKLGFRPEVALFLKN